MELTPLREDNLRDLVCLPGGLELAGKSFLGDLPRVAEWHRERLREGLRGAIAYASGTPRGFVEFMPAETAPLPIEAPGACVLLCFHWAGTEPEDPTHLAEERRMLEAAIDSARREFTGIAALGWNHPTHYPLALLTALGFREVTRDEPIALVWLPFREGAPAPRLAPVRFLPRNLSREGRLAIDSAWSSRCPYSVSFAECLRLAVAAQEQGERISFVERCIDTRADAFEHAASPWDWGWAYLNGRPINPFALPGDTLAAEIARHVPPITAQDSAARSRGVSTAVRPRRSHTRGTPREDPDRQTRPGIPCRLEPLDMPRRRGRLSAERYRRPLR